MNTGQTRSKPDLVLSRTFDAPREVVFKAWIDRDAMARWWGPAGFTNPRCELDPRPGGAIRIDMTGPDGTVYPMGGEYKVIEPPSRLVFISTAMDDQEGNPQLVNENTVEFVDRGGKTEITLTVFVTKRTPAVEGALQGMEAGWSQSLVRLGDELVKSHSV